MEGVLKKCTRVKEGNECSQERDNGLLNYFIYAIDFMEKDSEQLLLSCLQEKENLQGLRQRRVINWPSASKSFSN